MAAHHTSRTERICAFTDGVYAIVITLLVLDLKAPEVPGLTGEQLLEDLAGQSRNFMAYLISFFVAAWLWFRHHQIFKALNKCNNVVILFNFIHLLFVSLIPYTASLAGRYEQDQLAIVLFLVNLGVSGMSISLLSQYVVPKAEWHEKESRDQLVNEHWVIRFSIPVVSSLAIVVSFSSHDAALYLCFILPALLALATWR